jgi:hypothetical protein
MSTTNRFKLALALVAFAALGFVVFEYVGDRDHERRLHTDDRMPVANPPVDPNRPDLLEEPRIEE